MPVTPNGNLFDIALIGGGSVDVDTVVEIGPAYQDANKTYTPVNLTSNNRSASFSPLAGRDFYCLIKGSGSAPVRLEYSMDGGTSWAPMVTGVDGGAPIVLDSLAYSGSPVMLSGQVSKTGMLVSVMPGTVSGTVTVEFGQ